MWKAINDCIHFFPSTYERETEKISIRAIVLTFCVEILDGKWCIQPQSRPHFPQIRQSMIKKKQQKTRTPSGGVIAQNTAADVKQTKNDSPHQSFKGTRVEYKTRWFWKRISEVACTRRQVLQLWCLTATCFLWLRRWNILERAFRITPNGRKSLKVVAETGAPFFPLAAILGRQ